MQRAAAKIVVRTESAHTRYPDAKTPAELHPFWGVVLLVFCAWALFGNLGQAGLFEPDEGRNAEIAREILLLKDWVTPHYDFLPRLDKPILFFDLVALTYRLFGISEWSARLLSALAALGCLILTYRLSRVLFDRTAALWSALILLTSIEFFALSQIVILDMLLAFFLTLGLSCFFLGQIAADHGNGRAQFLCMYIAFGAATLTKGPIGFVLPAMVIFSYLFATRNWPLLQRMELPLGVPLFLLTASSWYLLAEFQNPGYLRHFLLQENVARFATDRFHRTQPWYFYFLALPAGFFPWSALLPGAVATLRRRWRSGEHLYLVLWISVPLLVLSLSSSKMVHYILPIFPPLAIVVGTAIAGAFRDSRARTAAFPATVFLLLSVILMILLVRPEVLPAVSMINATPGDAHVPVIAAGSVFFLLILVVGVERRRLVRNPAGVYFATVAAFTLFTLLAPVITVPISDYRSSRSLAERAAPHIAASDQLVLYGGYPSSLPFYLKIESPISVVWSGDRRQVLGSDYIALKRPKAAAGNGKVLYSHDEFIRLWQESDRRLVAFVDRGALNRFKQLVSLPFSVLMKSGDTVLIANRPAWHGPIVD
jgi:4-amino-4-deoxy-L-arabinose transferase-like glycosyltransferase